MKIITLSCSDCGTVVAANELEEKRQMKCPGLSCESVMHFEDLPSEDRSYFLENKDHYRL